MVFITFTPSGLPPASGVSLENAIFGISQLDSLLDVHLASHMIKVLPTYGTQVHPAASRLERTFVVYYTSGVDPITVAAQLEMLGIVERSVPNQKLWKHYGGTRRFLPLDSWFPDQWNLDNADDRIDIDAPEAWEIEKGDPSLILGIIDSGTMVDVSNGGITGTTPYRLHSDFRFFYNDPEDNQDKLVLDRFDLDGGDGGDSDTDGLNDNTIGYRFNGVPDPITDPLEIRFWTSVPSNWSWNRAQQKVGSYDTHGTSVASIAAGKTGVGNNIVGVANGCSVYILRDGAQTADSTITDIFSEMQAIRLAADMSKVVNMSWWLTPEPDQLFHDELTVAADVKDRVLVAIAGNRSEPPANPGDDVLWPGRYEEVLCVGNLAQDLSLDEDSRFGPNVGFVDVVAPVDEGIPANTHTGICFPHPCFLDEFVVEQFGGTSAAAPQVAGVAALVRSRFPVLNQQQVRDRVTGSAEWYWTEPPTDDERKKFGNGKINAYRALTEWGSITSNTTWRTNDTRDGMYYISGDLTIDPGVTLTIEPGVVVKVAPDNEPDQGDPDPARVQVIVKGTLVINAAENAVVFESFTDSAPTEEDWVGFRFDPGSKATLKGLIVRNASQDVVASQYGISVWTWNEKKTLYLETDFDILSDMTIASDEALYVLGSSDVEVTAGSGVDVTVNGTLVCKGVGPKKPTFASSNETPRSWGILTLSSTSTGNAFHNAIIRDAQLPILTYVPLTIDSCLLERGIDGIQARNDVSVRNTTIRDFTGNGIVWKAEDLQLRNVEIYNVPYGVSQSPSGSMGTFVCRGSKFHDISMNGMQFSTATTGLAIARTSVEDANDGIYLAVQSSVAIDSCTIRENDVGISLLGSAASIRRCVIDNNATAGVYGLFAAVAMETDTVRYSPAGVFLDGGSDATIGVGSRLVGNQLGLKCDNASDAVVRNTLITGSSVGVTALNDSQPNLGDAASGTGCGASGGDMGNNSIHSNSPHNVVNLSPSISITAEGDYWGPSGPQPPKFSGAVDYDPYICSNPLPTAPPDPPPPPGDERQPQVPAVFELYASRPNPFNPTTMMRYDVPPPGGHVSIVVYAASGAKVRVLSNRSHNPGVYEVTWEGRDERDAPVASGVYFVQMKSGSFMQTQKVVLLK
jgi:hypothetical protein